MCDLIEVECVKAEEDLVSACKQSLAHGALLATRYVLAEIDFNAGREEGHKELKVRILETDGFADRPPIHPVRSPRVAAAKTKPRLPLLTKP